LKAISDIDHLAAGLIERNGELEREVKRLQWESNSLRSGRGRATLATVQAKLDEFNRLTEDKTDSDGMFCPPTLAQVALKVSEVLSALLTLHGEGAGS